MNEFEKNLTHFSPESAFVPKSPESHELEKREEIEFVVENGKIEKIGDPKDVREWISERQKKDPSLIVTPEAGGIILPGMTDSHHHLVYGSLDVIQAGYVFGISSASALIESVKKQSGDGDRKKPKIFLGHNTALVPDVYRKDLDEAVPERPICLTDLSFHGSRLNTPMMKLLIEAVKREADPNLPGHLDEKTGQATEGYAILAIQVAEAYYDIEKIAEGMTGKLDSWIGQGITDIHEISSLSWSDLTATLMARKEWREKRGTEFPVRQIFMDPIILQRLHQNQRQLEKAGLFDPNKDWGMVGMKLLADGSFGSHTALMSEPFSDGIGGKGIEFHSTEQLNKSLALVREFGLNRIAMHAIGDAAVKRALDTAKKWMKIAEKAKLDPTKFRIEHFELPIGHLDEAKSLGVWANSEPNFLTDFVYEDRLSGRVTQICPHAEIIQKGMPMHFGSDGMPTSALFGIWAATHHPNPKQRISFEQALAAYSLMGAEYEHSGSGNKRGMIAEGAPADIVVLNRDTLNKMLSGDESAGTFKQLGENKAGELEDKVGDLEAGIMKIYRQGQLVKPK